MNKSASITNLAKALSAAQSEMPVVPMNSVNPFLKNKFADLGAVIQASRGVLAKYGLSISQFPASFESSVGVTSILMHTSGEWLEETITLPMAEEKGKSAAQVAGSIVTYLRRYSWSSILGLYADEDVDGNKPADNNIKQPKPAKELPSAHDKIMARWEELWNEARELGIEAIPLAPKMTDAEIVARGKELRAGIDAAKAVKVAV